MIGAQIGVVDEIAPRLYEGQRVTLFVLMGSKALWLIAVIGIYRTNVASAFHLLPKL